MYRITIERRKPQWDHAVSWEGNGPQPMVYAGEKDEKFPSMRRPEMMSWRAS